MNVHVVIPARLASSRLPEKLLLRAAGKSVLQHTYEAALRATCPGGVTVAVDDPRLASEVTEFGGHALITSPDCQSGTDRIAELAVRLPEVDVLVNVQGDEPEIDPAAIDLVAQLLEDHPAAEMATLACPIRQAGQLDDPHCVKVVLGAAGRAIYFSRSPVPHVRDGLTDLTLQAEPPLFWHHLGLYAYRPRFLAWFASQRPGLLELAERLEQLRAIEAGKQIVVGRVESSFPGIDTLADFEDFRRRVESA